MSQNYTGRSSQEDVAWCYDAVHRVSRTFSLTIAELEEPMARDICVGYLLCRVADTIEDAGHIPPAAQSELLRLYSRTLDPGADTSVRTFDDAAAEWLPGTLTDDWEVVDARSAGNDQLMFLPNDEELIKEEAFIVAEPDTVRDLADSV